MFSRAERPHVTIYYLFGSASLAWFAFGVPRMFIVYPELRSEPAVLIHLSASFVTILCCVCNHLWTPKVLGDRWKIIHIYCGRLGCVASCVGAIFGEIHVFLVYTKTGSINYLLVAVGVWQFFCTVKLFSHAKKNQAERTQGQQPLVGSDPMVSANSEADHNHCEKGKQVNTNLHIHYAHSLFYTLVSDLCGHVSSMWRIRRWALTEKQFWWIG